MKCLYDGEVYCGNKIKSKADCRGCETRDDALWDRRRGKDDSPQEPKEMAE